MSQLSRWCSAVLALLIVVIQPAFGHDHTIVSSHRALLSKWRLQEQLVNPKQLDKTCKLKVSVRAAKSSSSMPALLRVYDVERKQFVRLSHIQREANWYSVPADAEVLLPQSTLRLEATRGIAYTLETRELKLEGRQSQAVEIPLRRIFDARSRGLRNGNTHLHLMNLTRKQADEYLQLVSATDGLEVVFVSYLRRIPDEQNYITNSYLPSDLRKMSGRIQFGTGEEHRHNFGRGGEGYGHVMLLNIKDLVRPVSIGPGIMREGTDGIPLQRGIKTARADDATIVWCHNTFGFEDIPNFAAGLVHAQNIFDGGHHGSYKDSYYRYLNIGWKVPFSTGTDWFVYDFNRVYVQLDPAETGTELTPGNWLQALQQGRSIITNGPLLDLTVDNKRIGSTLALDQPGVVSVSGSGKGRSNFRAIELIWNGEVIAREESTGGPGYWEASIDKSIEIDRPGWLALRIPLGVGNSEFGRDLFAHTSPIYIQLDGKKVYRRSVVEELIGECKENLKTIEQKAVFANESEKDRVLRVHYRGIKRLEELMNRR